MQDGVSEVEFLINDLSLHGQFDGVESFRDALKRVMEIRRLVLRTGHTLHCHRSFAHVAVTPALTMPQAIQALTIDERRAVLSWLTQQGPFWEDVRNHLPDDWFEWNGRIVTDTAVGEAAWCCRNGIERRLISMSPSNWLFSPVQVDHVSDDGARTQIDVWNHWTQVDIETVLRTLTAPVRSWAQLETSVTARFTNLTFAIDAFEPLQGHPFFSSAAHRIISQLDILSRFTSCFDMAGQRTPEGHQIYQDFFTGKKGAGGRGALFSDSSDDEKKEFENKMTFKTPGDLTGKLFCPWHGKIQTPQMRVHFSMPIRFNVPTYIVYIGPKITKR